MQSAILLGLSFIGAVSAQAVAIPMPGYAASGSAAPTATGGSAPPSAYTPPPSAPQYTPPPYYETATAMPYSSFMGGGYKSMDCGYGYQKGSDGSCQKMSWVCDAVALVLMWRSESDDLCSTQTPAVTRPSSSTSKPLSPRS
jgi:hypothetical protein